MTHYHFFLLFRFYRLLQLFISLILLLSCLILIIYYIWCAFLLEIFGFLWFLWRFRYLRNFQLSFRFLSVCCEFRCKLPIRFRHIIWFILNYWLFTFFLSTKDIVLFTCFWGLSLLRSSLVIIYIWWCYFLYLVYFISNRTIDLLFLPNCFRDFDLTMPFDLERSFDLEYDLLWTSMFLCERLSSAFLWRCSILLSVSLLRSLLLSSST